MPPPSLRFEVQTQRFAYPDAQPGLIDPGRFGEDFARWLAATLVPLIADGYAISEPIQESYGWSIRVTHGRITIVIGIGLHFGPRTAPPPYGPGYWLVFVEEQIDLTPLRYIFSRRPLQTVQAVGQAVKESLERGPDITIFPAS